MIEDYLLYYYEKYKYPFRVQVFRLEPKKWIIYKPETEEYVKYESSYGSPNHREVLPCELVLDIDYHHDNQEKEKKALKVTLDAIKARLKELGFNYTLWKSGGSGYHFHLFFEELWKYERYERAELKRLLLRHIAYGYITPNEDRANVDLPVMIQVENKFSRKNKKKILVETYYFLYEEIPLIGGDKEIFTHPNRIPKEVLDKYNEEKAIAKSLKLVPLSENGEPNSIKYILSNDFIKSDGKKRAAFILASYYAQVYDNDYDKIYNKLYDWNNYSLNGYLTKINLSSTIKSVLKGKSRVSKRYRNEFLQSIGAPKEVME